MSFYFCESCAVQVHETCVTTLDASVRCDCAAENHEAFRHPDMSGNVWRHRTSAEFGVMREIDYDEEPFEQFPARAAKSGNKYGKPRDDKESVRQVTDGTRERIAKGKQYT